MILSSKEQPGLGRPDGQTALGKLKSPPKIMFGVVSNDDIADFSPLSGVIKSFAVDGCPVLLSSG